VSRSEDDNFSESVERMTRYFGEDLRGWWHSVARDRPEAIRMHWPIFDGSQARGHRSRRSLCIQPPMYGRDSDSGAL